MISKSTIDTVFETARVEEVIGDFVQLKRSGSNLKGLSPFTDERSPSFMVSPVKQIWKDFSSGKGGNVVAFLMEHEHFSYPEAIRFLAKKYNIEIEETEKTDAEKAATDARESLFLVTEFAQKYFHRTLLQTDEGRAIGFSYFKERGFTPESIEKFGLGYSPEAWDAFSKEALGQGYKLEFLESAGFTINKENRLIDRFRGRVMFPIHGLSGRVVGFGGRILTSDKKAAKYVNSPESDIYHKSKVLYGIFQAKQSIAKLDNCYLVEGYTDVIQMHQAGIENTVASSGTALTTDQVRLISRLTKNITVLFDGDAAGLRASVRGIDLILEAGMNVKVVSFPDGEDPDSFARKTPTPELRDYLEQGAKDFIRFKASMLMDEAADDPVKKAGLIRDMVASIAKIPDRIQREVYVQECARIMDISEQVLMNTLAQMLQKERIEQAKTSESKPFEVVHATESAPRANVDVLYELERKIIEILLLYGHRQETFEDSIYTADADGNLQMVTQKVECRVFDRIFLSLQEDEVELANPVFREVFEKIMEYYRANEVFEADGFMAKLPVELVSEVSDILMQDERESLHNWESQNIIVKLKDQTIAQYVTETILTLRWYLVNRIIDGLKTEISAENDNTEILSAAMDYYKLIHQFSQKLGRVMSRY